MQRYPASSYRWPALLWLAAVITGEFGAQAQRFHFPPVILTQPTNQTVLLGSNATFTVVAQCADPLYYQWRMNGAELPGATSSNLVLRGVTTNSVGDYAVLVRSIGGSTLSEPARLTVVVRAPNDAFDQRLPIIGTNVTVLGNNVGATRENGEPIHGGVTGGGSVWWSWTAPFTGVVTINTAGSDFWNVLAVYKGDGVSTLTGVASDLASGGYFSSQVSFSAVQGTAYQIAVQGYYSEASGNIRLSVLATTPPSLTLLQPQGGAAFGIGAPIEFKVNATDKDGQVVRVEYLDYYFSAQMIGVATNRPFGLVWTNALAGNHGIIVVATDDVGAAASTFVSLQVVPPPPANDSFAGRIDITQTNEFSGSNAGATKEAGEPGHAGNAGGASIWWTWTAPSDGPITIFPKSYEAQFILAVYTGSALTNLVPVASTDAANNGGSGVSFLARSNETYQIAVDSHRYDYQGEVLSTGNLTLKMVRTLPPDLAILSPSAGAVFTLASQDATTNVTVSATATDSDGSVKQVDFGLSGAQNYQFHSATNPPFSYTFTNLTFGSYYLSATATDDAGASQTTNLSFLVLAPPAGNDNFTNAYALSGTNLIVTDLVTQATVEAGERSISQYETNQSTVWWAWTAPLSGRFLVTADYSASYVNLAVFRGAALQTLNRLGNTDSGSTVLFSAAEGQIYYIAVDTRGQSGARIGFNLTGPILPPANDSFGNRIALTGNTAVVNSTTLAATTQTGDPAPSGSPAVHTVWYEWTPAEATGLRVEVAYPGSSSYSYLVVGVYTGTSLSALKSVGTGSVGTPASVAVNAGVRYTIMVDSPYDSGGAFTLSLSTDATPIVITTPPQSQSVLEGRTVALSVVATGFPQLFYQWQFNGTNLPGATKSTLVLKGLSTNQSGAYTVTITNTYSTVTSSPAILEVQRDTEPPRLVSARTFGNSNQVRLLFSEEVTGVTSLANYSLNNGIQVLGVRPDPADPRVVILTTTAVPRGNPNLVFVAAVLDLAGNPVAGGASAPVDTLFLPIVDWGEEVEGFQDDFEAPTLDSAWTPRGYGAGVYAPANGVLHVATAQSDPTHLLYEAPGYDSSKQEVLARLRVLRFATDDGSRAGICLAVDPSSNQGINYLLRRGGFEGGGVHAAFLFDFTAWGPSYGFAWKTNVWYWMRLRQEVNLVGGRADAVAKVWVADGATPEPANWSGSWDYTPNYNGQPIAPSAGFAGITAGSGALAEFEVDYILIKAAGLPHTRVAPKAGAPRPVFDTFQLASQGGLQLGLVGSSNTVYTIEISTNLQAWSPWVTVTNLAGQTGLLDPDAPHSAPRFYRAVGR